MTGDWGRGRNWVLVAALGLLMGLSGGHAQPLKVAVSVAPQKALVEAVGGDRVAVTVLVQSGADHHLYNPTPQQVREVLAAQLYIRTGLPFEDALLPRLRTGAKGMQVVDARAAVDLLPGTVCLHDHGPEGHAHEHAPDPHIWLSPAALVAQGALIRDSLSALDPGGAGAYEAGFGRLAADLRALDGELEQKLAPVRGRAMYVYHPAYGYFCQSYGLRQVAVEVDGREPGARHLRDLIEQAQADRVRAVFVDPGSPGRSARVLAETIGAEVVVLDPLAEDLLENLRRLGTAVARFLTPL